MADISKILIRLDYDHFFNDNDTVESTLESINSNRFLEILSILNRYEYTLREDSSQELKFILHTWLEDVEERELNRIAQIFISHGNKRTNKVGAEIDLSGVRIVNKISTLRTLELVQAKLELNNCDADSPGTGLNLFKLYLLVNKEITARQDIILKKYLNKERTKLDDIYIHLFLGITNPLVNQLLKEKLYPEVLKFLLFEKWLRTKPQFYSHSTEFLKKMKYEKWLDYFNDIFGLVRFCVNEYEISTLVNPNFKNVLSYLTIKGSENNKWTEFELLRNKPVIQMGEERFLVLDEMFLLDKVFSSLYHELLSFYLEHGIVKFSQSYNTEFIEEYFLKNLFKVTLGKSYIQYTESNIKSYSRKRIENISLPDYYVRNGNKILLIECKNSFISNKTKANLDPELLVEEIKNKFYFTINGSAGNKEKSKAIRQLCQFIKNSRSGEFEFFDSPKTKQNLVYYPILLVFDITLTKPGFNALLQYYFEQELILNSMAQDRNIRALTIISVDDLLLHQSKIKNLYRYIDKYHKYLVNKKSLDKYMSFSDYLTNVVFAKTGNPVLKKDVYHILDNSLLPAE